MTPTVGQRVRVGRRIGVVRWVFPAIKKRCQSTVTVSFKGKRHADVFHWSEVKAA